MGSGDRVAVVGAGLAGCLLACFLTRRGHRVTLYERRGDPRTGVPERGRSINLAISERGLDALRRIDLADRVLADALPMRGRMIHPAPPDVGHVGQPKRRHASEKCEPTRQHHGEACEPAGQRRGDAYDSTRRHGGDAYEPVRQVFQPYSADGERAINSIGRAALNGALLDAATAAGAKVRFDHQLVGLDPATGEMTFQTATGERTEAADVVLGTDGAGSAVRGQLLAHDLLAERLDFLDHGYKELTIPPRDGEFALDPEALHIWPRGESMMIALPNPDRSFTCTLFWPTGGENSFASLSSPAAIERHFAAHYPDVPALVPDLVADYQRNPVGLLGTVRCAPWQAYGTVAVLGDAAHAIVPFYGQGANCAFEDVVELDRCLAETGDDWKLALPQLELRRRRHTEAIAQMALENFVEMRDKVATPGYQLRMRVEHALERALPGRYVSRYELVSFTTMPYAQVRTRVRRQRWAVAAVAAGAALGTAVAARAAVRRRWRR